VLVVLLSHLSTCQGLSFLLASSTTQIATLMMVVYPGMILPSICISVVILPSDIVYMIVVYAIVGGGLLILSTNVIIIIALYTMEEMLVSTFTIWWLIWAWPTTAYKAS